MLQYWRIVLLLDIVGRSPVESPYQSCREREDALMMVGMHWWDLLPLIPIVCGLTLFGVSIGAGYALVRHWLTRRA